MKRIVRNVMVAVGFILTILFLIAAFALPAVLSVPFVLVCVMLYARRRRAELAMVLATLLIAFAGLEVAVRMLQDDVFYREQEKWAVRGRYMTSVQDVITMPFGDLVAMDGRLKDRIAEPRTIEFYTDSAGFRNDAEYAGEPFVLLGDSFTVGTGNSQEATLAAQLNRTLPRSTYSLAYPGDPVSYERNAERFLARTGAAPKFLWFMFEGNDFASPDATLKPYRAPNVLQEIGRRLTIRELPLLAPRFLTIKFRSLRAKLKAKRAEAPAPSPVEVHKVGGHEVGFLSDYVKTAVAPKVSFLLYGREPVMKHTACVFFVPDKARVYAPLAAGALPAPPEPAAGLEKLRAFFEPRGIRVVDLTPALRAAAKEALTRGEFVFWRDDSHWNARGIAAAVPEVLTCMSAGG